MDNRHQNLNMQSRNDLNEVQSDLNQIKEKSRPMTTRFGDRRNTQQPQMSETIPTCNMLVQDMNGVYERHGSP